MLMQPHTSQPKTVIFSLVKIGKKEHLEQLRTTGRLRMAQLGSFRELVDNVGRGDPNDGLAGWYQPGKSRLKFRDIEITGILEPIKVDFDSTPKHHVSCFHAITTRRLPVIFEEHGPAVDPKVLAMEEHALVITNVTKFIQRVKAAVRRAKISMQAGLVEYVDPATYHGELGAFRKFVAYGHQSEWRILVDPSAGEVFWLDLGSLEDISIVATSAEINSSMKFSMGPTKKRASAKRRRR
jgi:hypothetical protein